MIDKESHSSDHLTEATHRKVMATKVAAALAGFFLLASMVVIIAIAVVQNNKRTYVSPGLKYGIVLDAGSSGTRVYLYQWPAEKENNTGVVKETQKCQVNGTGISSLRVDAKQDQESWKSLKACMAQITEAIPTVQHYSTPIFLGATAGMRLLKSQDEKTCNDILRDMENYLQSLPFNFQNASIISGEEEGLYGWITVNYLMDNFLEKDLWNTWVRPHGARTVGSLDLGGASTQIAFTAPDDAQGEGLNKVSLYGYEYNVYTHSFLCYGKNEAEKRVLATLVKGSTNMAHVLHPCFPVEYNTTMSAEFIFGSDCTTNPTNYDPKHTITFFGTGDPARCRDTVRSIFDLQSCKDALNCSFEGVFQPRVTGDFMAYAGFYWTAWALKLLGSQPLDKFNSSTWSFCSTDWKTLKKNHDISEKNLKSYCYSANYVYTLLADGYKFNADNWETLHFQKQVKETSIGWSLGYMLSLSNMIPAEAKLLRLPMDNSVYAGLLFVFSALSILTFVFLIIMLVRAWY